MYVITDRCVLCYTCQAGCPAEALREAADGEHMQIDQDRCLRCGQCARVCPMHAVLQKPAAP